MRYEEARAQWEREYCAYLLKKHRGHMGNAAREAGKHRNTWSAICRRNGIDYHAIRRMVPRDEPLWIRGKDDLARRVLLGVRP